MNDNYNVSGDALLNLVYDNNAKYESNKNRNNKIKSCKKNWQAKLQKNDNGLLTLIGITGSGCFVNTIRPSKNGGTVL